MHCKPSCKRRCSGSDGKLFRSNIVKWRGLGLCLHYDASRRYINTINTNSFWGHSGGTTSAATVPAPQI
eukprot:scaffold388305_cov12-Prasinocladus_malaysianus.AAC.1